MSDARGVPIVRTWLGPAALAVVLVSAGWLLALWVPFHLAEPQDLAFVQSLREQARTDPDVQKVLLPETDRQTKMLVLRRTVYPRLGLVLAISVGVLLAWIRWLRPDQGTSTAPAALRRWIERRPPPPPVAPPSRFRPEAARPGALLAESLAAGPPVPAAETIELRAGDEIVRVEGTGPDAVIPILQAIQSHYRYLPADALRRVTETTAITPSQIAGVARS